MVQGVIVANIKSAEKRNRQNLKRNARNASVKSSIRTANKKIERALENTAEQNAPAVSDLLMKYIALADAAARKGIVHWKTIARKKSRFSRKVNALKAQ